MDCIHHSVSAIKGSQAITFKQQLYVNSYTAVLIRFCYSFIPVKIGKVLKSNNCKINPLLGNVINSVMVLAFIGGQATRTFFLISCTHL